VNWLDEAETRMVDQVDRSALNARMDAIEQKIANLEQFLDEVASDMLNRTRGARSFVCHWEEAQS
jgi:tetrahydromethanopterin S-methyltransferase subunit B